ncbi:DNA polymerase III subunit beta [Microbaculum marinum]|uniref:Beta sliding clamp n=1 Tax=Microbaculum marinum TaxID=1764581 RepID=A0AAW9RYH9_9HYPH
MRVTLERAAFLKSLGHVHRVVERRNTIPILSNVLVRVDGTTLQLKATDLDIEVVETVSADVSQPGATTVPAHVIYDIVRKLPDGAQVQLESGPDSGTIVLSAGHARFSLQTLPESDFPDITAGEFTHRFMVPAVGLKRLIDKTQFAISQEETRYYLNGIYLHAVDADAGPMLRAVATDGHRLARVEIDGPDGASGMPGIIVPRKAVQELQRLLEDPEEAVGVELSTNKIRFTIGQVVLTSKLIDGTFPDYGRVIPTGNEKIMTVDRESFGRAVDLVSTVSSERGRAVKLAMSDDNLVLTVNNPDSGSATEEIPVGYSADALEIGFNARYLLDIIGQLETGEARFELADPGSPTLICDDGDRASLYVLMPMRV